MRLPITFLAAWTLSALLPGISFAYHILLYHNSQDGTRGTLLQCAAILRDGGHQVTTVDVKGRVHDPTDDNWGEPYDQVWDMRFVNLEPDPYVCGVGSTSSPDHFGRRWRSKAVSFLNRSGNLFLAGEYFQLAHRNEGLYGFLEEVGAVWGGYSACPPSPRGNSATEDPAFYPVRHGLGPVSFFGAHVGGIPTLYLSGTSFVETKEGWVGDRVNRSIASGWTGGQLGGAVEGPLCSRGKLFMVWEASMWPVLWSPGASKPYGKVDVRAGRGSTRMFVRSVARWLGGRVSPCDRPEGLGIAEEERGLGEVPEEDVRRVERPLGVNPPASSEKPRDIPLPWASLGAGQTITFSEPPVNVHMRFADGPGRYHLAVYDAQGSRLAVLFNHHIMEHQEAWATWDGVDEFGVRMSAGLYYAIFSKEGKALRKIVLNWIEPKD